MKKIIFSILFLPLLYSNLYATSPDNKYITENHSIAGDYDSIYIQNIISETLGYINSPISEIWALNEQDDAMSFEEYYKIWTSERINPYGVKIDAIPDSILIDCRNFCYPTESRRITSRFGIRGARFHYGIDLGVKYGDTIRASFSGRVRMVHYDRRGYGRYVVIRHDNGLETLSGHLSRTLVHENDSITAGQPIGLGGNTGRSTGPHLHYEIRFLGNAFNPAKLIDFDNAGLQTETGSYLLTINDTYSHKPQLEELSRAAYHRVRSGETLSHIARRYGTTVRRLCALNKIKETSIIRIGQSIRYR